MRRERLVIIHSAAALVAALTFVPTRAATPAGPLYAIKGARVFTAAGAPIDNGTIVMRDGVIEDVGANVTAPADAIVIDGAGMSVYPGLIDMTNDAPIDTGEDTAAAAGGDVARPGAADAARRRRSRRSRRPNAPSGRRFCDQTLSPRTTSARRAPSCPAWRAQASRRCSRFRRRASSRARARS